MLRCLVVVPTDRLGGAETVMKTLVRELLARGCRVTLLVLSRGNNGGWSDLLPRMEVKFVRSPKEKLGMLLATPWLWRASSREWSLVVSSLTHVNAWLGWCRHRGILKTRRLVFRESTVMVKRFAGRKLGAIRRLYALGYGPQDLTICQTADMKQSLEGWIPGAATWECHVIPNPVDIVSLKQRSVESLSDGVVPEGPYICTVGRLIELKGVDVLIEAFAALGSEFIDLHLVIVGDGPERARLEALVERRALGARVRFLGRLSNPMPVLRRSALGVVCSRVEGFPNTLLEMMTLCPAVVSTLCAGGIENIQGICTCAPGDAAALAAAIVSALEADPELNRRLMDEELLERTPQAFCDAVVGSLVVK
jgi:glycosyltransferase involved in cell wall biosynthesis